MPWRESCAMDERVSFIADQRAGLWMWTELCERYEISRKTGYPSIRSVLLPIHPLDKQKKGPGVSARTLVVALVPLNPYLPGILSSMPLT